jgi:cell shape-determining protein MreC
MDVVITSGLDQIYPKVLMVGRVTRIGGGTGLFKEIYVTPSTRFEEIEDVLVAQVQTADLSTPESVH